MIFMHKKSFKVNLYLDLAVCLVIIATSDAIMFSSHYESRIKRYL